MEKLFCFSRRERENEKQLGVPLPGGAYFRPASGPASSLTLNRMWLTRNWGRCEREQNNHQQFLQRERERERRRIGERKWSTNPEGENYEIKCLSLSSIHWSTVRRKSRNLPEGCSINSLFSLSLSRASVYCSGQQNKQKKMRKRKEKWLCRNHALLSPNYITLARQREY